MQQEIESNKTRLKEVLIIENTDTTSYQAPKLAEAFKGAYERRNWDIPPDHVYSTDISVLDYNSIVSLLEKENPAAKELFVKEDSGIVRYDSIYYSVHITRR